MRALEDSGHLHDTDVIIVSDHGQMDLSRVIKPNVFFADAGLIQVDEKRKSAGLDSVLLL